MREFDLVTLDRVRRIDIEPKLSVWQEYARAHRLHPAVTAYLELRPSTFIKSRTMWTACSSSPRAAGRTFCLFAGRRQLGLPVDEGVIAQYLRHPRYARDFAAYWVLYRKYHQDYGVEDILQGKPV